MNPVSTPVDSWNRVVLQEPRQVAVRCHGCAVDLTPTEPDRILLAEIIVKSAGELVLMLRIRIAIERVAIRCWVVGSGLGIDRLDESNQPRIDQVGWNNVSRKRLAGES